MGGNPVSGTVYGIGVGPGDPDLITIKAQRLLRDVPVIAYPAPSEGDSLARRIAAPHIGDGKTEIAIRTPLDRARFPAHEIYDRAAKEIGEHLGAGRDVAVLCEGDPFFYGSFMYLFARLASDWPVEVVPGVSSLTAAAAMLGVPLAARDDVLTVLPATLDKAELRARLAQVEAAAIIKLGRHFAKVRTVLEELGLAVHARYIEHATMADQRILALAEVEANAAPYFSMILLHRRGEAWR
jgi:precorrin-2/cobalt-factor-2 C20-methyltransferase